MEVAAAPWLICLICIMAAAGLDQRDANVENILSSLKESGVIDQFEKDLRVILQQEKAKKKEAEAIDVAQYVKAYADENNIMLRERVIGHLADLPITDNVYQHLVRLNGLVDRLGQIDALKDRSLIEKADDLVSRIKTVSVMKNSLDKLYKEATAAPKESAKGEASAAADHPQPKDQKELDDVADTLITFLQMIKAKPEQMMSMILPAIEAYELLSKETLIYVEVYSNSLIKSDSFSLLMDTLISWVEQMMSTDSGRRIVRLVPSMAQAKDRQQILKIIHKETEYNWNQFFKSLQNSDLKQDLLDSLSGAFLSVVSVVRDFLHDDMKMALVNTFLLTQGLPAVHTKKLVPSLISLLEKSARFFTVWDVNVRQYDQIIHSQISQFERDYIGLDKFWKLSLDEQKRLTSQFLDDNLAEPAQLLFTAHQHVTYAPGGAECAQVLLCALNQKVKESGNAVKVLMARGLSLAASWAWQMNGQGLDEWSLYKAIWDGGNGADCEQELAAETASQNCHIFPWQTSAMSLDFEHTEL